MKNHFKRIKIVFFSLLLSLIFSIQLNAQQKAALSNHDASKEAVALFRYLNDMYGKKILSGQMCSTWSIDELKYIKEITGRQPAIRGMDFINDK